MREQTNKILKTLCIYMLVISMTLSSLVGSLDVMAATVEAPTIDNVFYGATSISGKKLHRDRVGGKAVRATVYVTLKDKNGNVKDNVSVTPKSGSTWTVNLTGGVEVAEGDTVTVYQELNGQRSSDVTANAEPSKAYGNKDKLKMPTGEIWIEQYVANIVNDDEKAEALDLLKKANPDIANDIKSIEFKITGVDSKTASYVVTYSDDSKTEEIQAPDLTVKQVTEYSMNANLDEITIVDNVIKGKLQGEGPFDGIKVQLIIKVNNAVKNSYCDKGECLVDKNTPKPVNATVNGETGEFSYTIQNPNLELDNVVGVTVKEKNKFLNCSKTTVIAPTPKKTDVKDPKRLTDADKGKIIEAIKTAYTVNGVSKLPNGTGEWDGIPAFIEFDKDGNARIINPSNVNGSWENYTKFIPEKKDDGSLSVTDESKVITIPAKDLVLNKAPDEPKLVHDADKAEITITPAEVDTDAQKIEVTYKGLDDTKKTVTASKDKDGNWTTDDTEVTVTNEGVITLPTSKIKGDTEITAKVTDIGGLVKEEEPLTSEPGKLTLSKADKVNDLGGLDPVDIKKWVGDTVDWKDGVKAKDSSTEDNKAKIKELLDEAKTKFTDETTPGRNTDTQGDYPGTIKVTFDDDSFIEVENQKLYVSDLVSPSTKENLPDDAIDVKVKLGEGVKVEDKDPNSGKVTKTTKGDKDQPVLYKEYKVKPGTNFSTYKHPTLQKTIFDLIDDKADEGYTKSEWIGQDKVNPKNFVVSTTNNVFTATATKLFKVTFNGNTGTGSMNAATVKKGEIYTLPENGFTAPGNKKFVGWKVGNENKKPGDKITITGDTVIKAVWKDKTTTPDKPVDPNQPGTEPGTKPNPDSQVYRPWWPIWFESSDVKPATPKVEYERGLHRKYLYGYKDHTVRPEGLITRAEAAALIARLAELDMSDNSKPNFKDTKSAWYNTAINAVVAKNLMFANKDGDFRPNEPITRGEFARALFFIDKKNDAVAPFADVKGHVYEEAINLAYGNNRIKGYPDGTFKPDATITRAEAATILNNYAGRSVTSEGMSQVRKDVVKFKDLSESHWAYYEIMEAANTHYYQREKGTIPEYWEEILKK